jgi:hypothetical protein
MKNRLLQSSIAKPFTFNAPPLAQPYNRQYTHGSTASSDKK